MSAVLDTARRIERDRSGETNLTIRLTLFQDLIAEIERLEEECDRLEMLVPATGIKAVKAIAEKRQEGAA